jgi:hypothetical protein
MFYDRALNRGAIVGGRRTTSTRSTWFYTLRSTGTWESAPLSTEMDRNIGWESLSVKFSSAPLLAGTSLYLQVAYSTDGVQFDSFRGPAGSTSAYYLVREYQKRFDEMKTQYEDTIETLKHEQLVESRRSERELMRTLEEKDRQHRYELAQQEASAKERERYIVQNYEDQLDRARRSSNARNTTA